MIEFVYGSKGSGKTKKMIEAANTAAAASQGDIVFITDTDRYSAEIKYSIRFTNTAAHGIRGEDGLLGFIKGLIAGNYDIKEMFIDGTMRILGVNVLGLESFILGLEKVAKESDVKFVISVSADFGEFPEVFKKYIA